MIRTYLDTSVYLAAWRGEDRHKIIARRVLEDEQRELVSSLYVALELLPKASFHRREDEVQFYGSVLSTNVRLACTDKLVEDAIAIASSHDIQGVDALHLAAAIIAGADEFITSEAITKPIYKVQHLRVRHLADC